MATGGSSSVRCYAAWVEKRFVAEGTRDECSATRTRRRTSSSPARERARCSRRSGRKFPSCSWTWVCAFPCWRLAGRQTGERPASLHRARDRAADARSGRLAAFHARAAAAHRRRRRGLSAADAREPAAPELQVPRRALRLGPLVQRARLQRLRFRGLSQLRRAAAAQHARPGREPGAEPHRVHRRRRSRAAAGGAARPPGRRSHLHSRPRHDGDRPRQRRAVRDPRHDRHQLPRRRRQVTRVHLNGVSVTPLMPLLATKSSRRSTASTASNASANEPMHP